MIIKIEVEVNKVVKMEYNNKRLGDRVYGY